LAGGALDPRFYSATKQTKGIFVIVVTGDCSSCPAVVGVVVDVDAVVVVLVVVVVVAERCFCSSSLAARLHGIY
jgi:hypothetical protein